MTGQKVTMQPDEFGITRVELPDGQLRIFEPAADSNDASRMYVLSVLGIDVMVRWTDTRKGPDGSIDWDEAEDGSPYTLLVNADTDTTSARPFSGQLWINEADCGLVEADS